MTDDLDRKLTPDAMEFARFVANATPLGGLAVSNAILLVADITATDMLLAQKDGIDDDYEENAAILKNLFPFVSALSPLVADGYAMKFPFLWKIDAN